MPYGFIYLCTLGILVGLKMLTDARRLSRTTLFSLEQERAGEQSYRALVVIVVFFAAIGGVTVVNIVGPALVPTEISILRGATPTLPAFIFPTNTPVPTSTSTAVPRTETPIVTSVPITPTATRTVQAADTGLVSDLNARAARPDDYGTGAERGNVARRRSSQRGDDVPLELRSSVCWVPTIGTKS